MKGFMSQLASGAVGKNLQEGLGSLANKAQGLAHGLAQGLPKTAGTGGPIATTGSLRNLTGSEVAMSESQLQLQAPYSADEEGAIMRQQLVQLQVKNGMLQSELEEARSFAEEAARLRGLVSDLETKLLFALKGTAGMEPLLPKVIQEQQRRIDDLTTNLAERDGQAAGLRSDNARLRCKVEDLMASMAASARHAEVTHNEQLREMHEQLVAAQEELRRQRAGDVGSGGGGSDVDTATLREQLQHARNVIKELEEEAEELRTAADEARAAAAAAAGGGRGAAGVASAEALEWQVAELEEQLEEANDKLKAAESKIGSSPSRAASSVNAALEAQVEKLRSELESERGKVADVAAAAASEAVRESEASMRELQKRVELLGKEGRTLAAARDAAEKRAADMQSQLEALQAEHQKASAHAEAVAEVAVTTTQSTEASIAGLQSKLDAAAARAVGLELELAAAAERCGELQQQLAAATVKVAAVEDLVELEHSKEAAARAEVAELRARAELTATQLAEAQRAVAVTEQRAGELATDLVVTQRKLETATERIVLYTEREHEAEQIVASYTAAEARYTEAQEQIERLSEALAQAQAEVTSVRDEAERGQEQAQLAGEAMAKLRARLDMMNERKAVLEAQAEELQGKLAVAQAELAALRGQAPLDVGPQGAKGNLTEGLTKRTVEAASGPEESSVAIMSCASTDTVGLPRRDMPAVSTDTVGLPRPDMPAVSTDTDGLPRPDMLPASTDTVGLPRPDTPAVSTDTVGLPRPDMPAASTDTVGLPRPDMPAVSTDTDGLPRPDMPAASTDTVGLPRPDMPAVSTDTDGLKLQPQQSDTATDTEGLKSAAGPASAEAASGLDMKQEEERQHQLVSELMAQLAGLQASMETMAQQLQASKDETEQLRAAAKASAVGPANAPIKRGSTQAVHTAAAALAAATAPRGDGWDQEDNEWDAWDGEERAAAAAAPGLTALAEAVVAAEGAPSASSPLKEEEGGASPVVEAAVTSALPAAEARLSAYASELALLQDTIKQLLGCWSGAATPSVMRSPMAGAGSHTANGDMNGSGDSTSNGLGNDGPGQEEAVLGGTVVALLGQLQSHFQEAASMRLQLEEAESQLQGLRANGIGLANGVSAAGLDQQQRMAELEDEMTQMMQDMAAAEQRAQTAEAAATAAASWRQQLEAQLQRSDEAAAAAEDAVRQRDSELQEAAEKAIEAAERAAEASRELDCCRVQLAEARVALTAAYEARAEAEAAELAARDTIAAADAEAAEKHRQVVERERDAAAAAVVALAAAEAGVVEARSAAAAAESRAAAEAGKAEARVKELEAQLAASQRPVDVAPSAGSAPATMAAVASVAAPAASFSIPAEHLGLMRQIAAAAQTFAPLFNAVKASRGSVDELSQRVSELETLTARLDVAIAASGSSDASASAVAPPPSYEQSFQSKHIGPAGAASIAADAAAETEAAAGGSGGCQGTAVGAGAGVIHDQLEQVAATQSGFRRSSEDTTMRQRVGAAEAAAHVSETELRVLTNLAESLRAELAEQQAANEALRASMVPKSVVASLEASYKEQLERLETSLGKTADKQARQFAAFEEEHSQALAAEQAQRVAAVAAAIKAAEARSAELEVQLEAARRNGAAAEERVAGAEAAAEESRRLAQDIERGWGERLDRLQKINKKRAAELDEARAECSGLNQRVADLGEHVVALQAELVESNRLLELEQAAASQLRLQLDSLQIVGDTAGLEVSELRARILAEKALRAEVEQRAVTAEARLQASEADRSKLADQLVLLHSLREERAAALAALAEAREGLAGFEATRVRCDAAEAARDRAALELGRVSAMLGNLEARLQQVEDENEGLVAELDEERRRGAALARTWAGELEALPGLPRDRWPSAVRRLVDGLESRAGGENTGRVSELQGNARELVAGELEALREAIQAAEERAAHAEAEAEAALAALNFAQRQADETRARAEAELRVESARRLEEALRAQLQERGDALEGELKATRDQLRAAEAATAQLQDELQRLRDKSRAIMEEKDTESDALRAQLRQARAAVGASLASRVAGGSSASLSGGAAAAADEAAAAAAPSQLRSSFSGASVASAPSDPADPVFVSLRSQIASLQHDLEEYKHAYEDAESTHELRDTAQAALREELARLQAQVQLSNQDIQYLRAAVISFFESGSLPRDGPVMQVLSRLLRFTPAEKAAIAAAEHTHRSGKRGTGGSAAAPAPTVGAHYAAPAAGGGGVSPALGLLASVTSKMASAVSGRSHPAATPGPT